MSDIQIIKNNNKILVSIRNINKREFEENRFVYILQLSEERLNVKIVLHNRAYYFIEGFGQIIEEERITMQKKQTGYQIDFQMIVPHSQKYGRRAAYPIQIHTNSIQIQGVLNQFNSNQHTEDSCTVEENEKNEQILKGEVVTTMKHEEIETKKIESKKKRKRKERKPPKKKVLAPERAENMKKLLEKFEQLDSANINKTAYLEKELDEKKIYLRHPQSRRRCENCISYSRKRCTTHQIEVSENHGCARFHTYQVYRGGSFSPR